MLNPQAREQNAAQEREDRRRARLFEDLIVDPAWKEYEKLLVAIHNSLVQQVMAPLESGNGVYRQEYNKGAMWALQLAANLPKDTITGMIAANRAANEDQSDDDDDVD